MDVAVERPPPPPPPVKEEKETEIMEIGSSGLPIVFESFAPMQQRDPITKKDEKLEATKAEMGEVREENERLKTLLSHIARDYQSLQMHFLDVVKVNEHAAAAAAADKLPPQPADDLVSLSLGNGSAAAATTTTRRIKGHERLPSSSSSGTETDHEDQLSLGLSNRARGASSRPSSKSNDDGDRRASPPLAPAVLNLSSDNSADDVAAEPLQLPAASPQTTTKARKSPSAGAGDGADDEVLQQQAKKARVSVRVKCDTPTMNDGCQWRKYGQKISKGNPCPRAYYRCTVAPSCPVRKQVQRCADDMSILITTYEGAHSHPLPPPAAAMASTTSAAASMLLAGPSSSSSSSHGHHLPFASAGGVGLLGPTTISTAASCPTVTLDLTAPHSGLLHHSSPYAAAGYESKALPAAWSSGYLAYGAGGQPPYYAKSTMPTMGQHFGLGLATRPAEQLFGSQSSYLQRSTSIHGAAPAPAVTDTIAKAITSDPSFHSVLAAAITSYMGRGAAAHK